MGKQSYNEFSVLRSSFLSLKSMGKFTSDIELLTFFLRIRLFELLAECGAGAFEHLLELAHAVADSIAQGGALEVVR